VLVWYKVLGGGQPTLAVTETVPPAKSVVLWIPHGDVKQEAGGLKFWSLMDISAKDHLVESTQIVRASQPLLDIEVRQPTFNPPLWHYVRWHTAEDEREGIWVRG
jgi:hypothetical protein